MDNDFLNALMSRHNDDCAEDTVATVATLAKKYGWPRDVRLDVAGHVAKLVCRTVTKTADLLMEIDAAK
jgi:hypothetical protein